MMAACDAKWGIYLAICVHSCVEWHLQRGIRAKPQHSAEEYQLLHQVDQNNVERCICDISSVVWKCHHIYCQRHSVHWGSVRVSLLVSTTNSPRCTCSMRSSLVHQRGLELNKAHSNRTSLFHDDMSAEVRKQARAKRVTKMPLKQFLIHTHCCCLLFLYITTDHNLKNRSPNRQRSVKWEELRGLAPNAI